MMRRPIQTATITASALLLGATVAAAHVGFSARQRVVVDGNDVTVLIWMDRSHASRVARDDLEGALRLAAGATAVDGSDGPCPGVDRSARPFGRWMFELRLRFRCASSPRQLELSGPAALGAGSFQHVELHRDGTATGLLRPTTTRIDLAEAPPAIPVLWLTTPAVGAAFVLILTFLVRSWRRTGQGAPCGNGTGSAWPSQRLARWRR